MGDGWAFHPSGADLHAALFDLLDAQRSGVDSKC
jgi:hypothetical protein